MPPTASGGCGECSAECHAAQAGQSTAANIVTLSLLKSIYTRAYKTFYITRDL